MFSLYEFTHWHDRYLLGDCPIFGVHPAIIPPIGFQFSFRLFLFLLTLACVLDFAHDQPHFQILLAVIPCPIGRIFNDESKFMARRRTSVTGLSGAGAVTGSARRLASLAQFLGDSPKMMSLDMVST